MGLTVTVGRLSVTLHAERWTRKARWIEWSCFVFSLLVVLALVCDSQVAESASAVKFYVASNGNDAWSGRSAAPSRGAEGPFRTITRARDAIRSLKQRGALPGPVSVFLRGGDYPLAQPISFVSVDSGSKEAPINYEAYPGETPLIDGGQRITGWTAALTSLSGANPAARGRIFVADVSKGWQFNQLFFNGQRLPRSSIPVATHWEQWFRATGGEGRGTLFFQPGSIPPLGQANDAEIDVLPSLRFFNEIVPIVRMDWSAGRIYVVEAGPYRIKKGDPFRIENLLAGITQPGQWSVDPVSGKVYCWPPDNKDPNKAIVVAPRLSSAFVIQGNETSGQLVRFLNFIGLELSYFDRTRYDQKPVPPLGHGFFETNDAAILLSGTEDCAIEHCKISRVGGIAIRALFHDERLRLVANEISSCGGQGIVLNGYGPGTLNVNRFNTIANNHISFCGQIFIHAGGVICSNCGDTEIVGNNIHNMPSAGITLSGFRASGLRAAKIAKTAGGIRWQEIGDDPLTIESATKFIPGNVTITRNVVHDTMEMIDDGGAIASWAGHNHLISHNVIYRCARDSSYGIYLDDDEHDSTIENNLIFQCPMVPGPKVGAAIIVHDNGRNTVRNNIFALADRLWQFPSSYGGHRVTNNIFLFGKVCDFGIDPGRHGAQDFGASQMDYNLFWSTAGPTCVNRPLLPWRSSGWDRHSIVADPGFRDPAHFDFSFSSTSSAHKIGFDPNFPLPRYQH